MEQASSEFEQLMERARNGCPEAAQQVFDRYGPYVRRVVRRLLRQRLRRRYDSTDFTQSVWASFFEVSTDQYSFPTPAALVAFLSRVAYTKVMATTRQRLGMVRHNMAQECSIEEPDTTDPTTCVGERLPDRAHTPSQYVIADERWQLLIRGLPVGHRKVLELLRDGHSHIDISRQLGIDRKVIQRLLEHLRRHAEAL